LKQIGYEVIILWEDPLKEIDAMEIRELIRRGDESRRQKVPSATAKAMAKYHIRERIIENQGPQP